MYAGIFSRFVCIIANLDGVLNISTRSDFLNLGTSLFGQLELTSNNLVTIVNFKY